MRPPRVRNEYCATRRPPLRARRRTRGSRPRRGRPPRPGRDRLRALRGAAWRCAARSPAACREGVDRRRGVGAERLDERRAHEAPAPARLRARAAASWAELSQRCVHRAGVLPSGAGAPRAVPEGRLLVAEARAQLGRDRFRAAAPGPRRARARASMRPIMEREIGPRRRRAGEVVGDAQHVVVPAAVEVLHLAQQRQRVRVVLDVDACGLHEQEDEHRQQEAAPSACRAPRMFRFMAGIPWSRSSPPGREAACIVPPGRPRVYGARHSRSCNCSVFGGALLAQVGLADARVAEQGARLARKW